MPNIALHALSSETHQSSSDFCTDTILLNILVIVLTKSVPASILSYLLHEEARKIFCLVSQLRKGQLLLKARAIARNIVSQQDATLLGPTCCERLHTMLCVVATCWKLLDEV